MQIVLKDIRSIGELPVERPCWVEEKRWNSIQNIKACEDKMRSFASAYLLSDMCRELGVDTPAYGYTENGKPFLCGAECAFNLSHSGDYVALAYHTDAEAVGVDIQKVRAMRDGMERRILHKKEWLFLPEEKEKRTHYLNRLWAVKESFVKMTGEGLSRDFRIIYVDFENGTVVTEDDIRAEFSVWKWKDGYYLAVCSVSKEACEIKEI